MSPRWVLPAIVGAMVASHVAADPFALLDASGHRRSLLTDARAPVVVVFVRADCPLSNRYAPLLRRLGAEFAKDGVRFFFVYPDPAQTPGGIAEHRRRYDFGGTALRDTDHRLVKHTGARTTPEAVVLQPDGTRVYRGRIDDWYVSLTRSRAAPRRHDLHQAIAAALRGETVTPDTTEAIGCYIEDVAP